MAGQPHRTPRARRIRLSPRTTTASVRRVQRRVYPTLYAGGIVRRWARKNTPMKMASTTMTRTTSISTSRRTEASAAGPVTAAASSTGAFTTSWSPLCVLGRTSRAELLRLHGTHDIPAAGDHPAMVIHLAEMIGEVSGEMNQVFAGGYSGPADGLGKLALQIAFGQT